MTTFQIISLVFSFLLLFGAIVGVYVRTRIDVAKLEVNILNIQRELVQKEISFIRLEDKNSAQHDEIIKKIDKIYETINKK